MRTITNNLTVLIFLVLIANNAFTQNNYLKEAIETKINYVKNNQEQDKIAKETHWYEQMEETLKSIDKTSTEKGVDELIPPYPDCSIARPLCLETVDDYYLNTNNATAEQGPDYNCLYTTPNPTWFYIKTTNDTNIISMTIWADSDIDFITWGPFNDVTCDSLDLCQDSVADCSYSTGSNETITLNNIVENSYYMILVTNYANVVQNFHFQLNSGYLDCTPVQNYNDLSNITGNVYFDDNQNCELDSNEYKIPNSLIKFSPGNHYAFTNDSGYYELYLPLGDYTYEIINPENDSIYCLSDTLHVVDVTNIDTINISSHTDNTYNATINISCPSIVNNPVYYINYSNYGYLPVNGEITVTLDTALTIVSASESYTTINANTISFSYSDLLMYENRHIQIEVNALDTVSFLNYIATTTAEITCTESDVNLANNISTNYSTILLPFDPNDISASPYGNYEINLIHTTDTFVVYTVNFQNTGSAIAHNVNIFDTIPSCFNYTSIEILASSYSDVQLFFEDSNAVRFNFPNIELIDSVHNEAESHGFITYRLRTNTILNIGDTIPNFADIYFDNNPAVKTNIVESIVIENITDNYTIKNNNIVIYPNPTNSILNIKCSSNIDNAIVEIYSIDGKLVSKKLLENINSQISVNSLPKGIYSIRIISKEMNVTSKFIKN